MRYFMRDFEKKIEELQNRQFGAVNELHSERTKQILQALADEYGEEVLDTASSIEIDYISLMTWHLKRTADLIQALRQRFGDEVFEKIMERERKNRRENGSQTAKECGGNTLQDIIPYFGGEKNIVKRSEQGCLLRTQYCGLAKAAGMSDFVYQLHCCNDLCFVEGFNHLLGCEVQKSLLHGDDCCEHFIFEKEK